MKVGKETILQIQVCNWLRQCHPNIPFIHIANERSCSIVHGMILKRMGVKRGVSDLFFPKSNETKGGLWLELKTEQGKPTEHQIAFVNAMLYLGYEAKITYGFEESVKEIELFYGLS